LRYHVVQSDTGMMGGLGSHEFMAPSAAGEDEIAICAGCGYAANVELARGVPAAPRFPPWTREEVATPNARTIAEVSKALGIAPALTIKSLLYMTKSGPVLALVRGDHAIHERKLARTLGEDFRPAQPDEVLATLGAPVGSVGPLGVSIPVLADETLSTGTYVVGANREGFHVRGVTPGRDFACRFVDLHTVQAGEACTTCGTALGVERVIEIGNIFKLGTKYSVALGAMYLDEHGREQPIVMGSYGIGPARIAAAAIEQRADADGIVWPPAIAPFAVHVVAVNVRDATQATTAESIYDECRQAGLDTLLDDREERPGVKFKDADLLGVPVRVTVGNAFVKEGLVEVRSRGTRREVRVPRAGVVEAVREALADASRGPTNVA
jgi:prolyl-tRNA synthetase